MLLHARLTPAYGHPGLDERIAQLTAEIAAQPTVAGPRLERAELYRQHGQFDEALADLAVAENNKSNSDAIKLQRAQVFYDMGQFTNALAMVQSFLVSETNRSDALVLRARCRMKLQPGDAAVVDYTAALANIAKPEPDLWLERARSQAALGRFADAIKGLDEGIARIGDVPTLELAAIEYERALAAFDAAVARVDKLTGHYAVKEPWRVLRGEILEQAGRTEEARAAFEQALAGIDQYPSVRRNLELTTQLEARARAGLARVERKLPESGQKHLSSRHSI